MTGRRRDQAMSEAQGAPGRDSRVPVIATSLTDRHFSCERETNHVDVNGEGVPSVIKVQVNSGVTSR